ncbi:MAG: hypothetical protein ACREK6_03220 [Candidatus Rokuibacteriota bacterium]
MRCSSGGADNRQDRRYCAKCGAPPADTTAWFTEGFDTPISAPPEIC